MIVQSAPEGESRFVITMSEHTAMAGALARAFGNDSFEAVEPREPMLYVIENHDVGWRELDTRAPADPATGLPYHLVQTPFELIVETSSASPERNSQQHPYCGLISSMHSWGLYNGRYGMSDMVLLDTLAAENRSTADRMLAGEEKRQEALKTKLLEDPSTAGWLDEARLFQNYKQLQFFDTLALYFNCTHEAAREQATFQHVPQSASRDVEVTITPRADGAYAFEPFPFCEDGVELSFSGRYMEPSPADADGNLGDVLRKAETRWQTLRLVA